MVQWLRLCAPDAGGLGSIPGQGNRSHMLQLRVCMGQEFAGARGSLRPGRVPEPDSRPQRGACCPAKKKKKKEFVCLKEGGRSYVLQRRLSILKSRNITLPAKVCISKVWFFPVAMHGYENLAIKKTEHQRIDAFIL